MFEINELSLYRGKDISINKNVNLHIPTVSQIEEFGESKYFSSVRLLTSVGSDLKWQLWELGVDFTKISDYELFIKLLSQWLGSKKQLYNDIQVNPDKYKDKHFDKEDLENMLVNPLGIILNVDLSDYLPCKKDNGEIVLYNLDKDIVIDRLAYRKIVEIVRRLHGFKRNDEMPANEATKEAMIEDAKDEYDSYKSKPFTSVLLPLVSTLQTYCGQCGDNKIWDMPISALFDNVKRIGKIQDANLLLQGAYSGFNNLKGIDKKRLDMFGKFD